MIKTAPESGPAFDVLMREIDAALVHEGIPIPSRSIHAIMSIGKRFGISMPIVPVSPGAPPEVARHNQLAANVHAWYELVYGERVKMDFSPGKVALIIDGDLYRLSLPRILGTAHFFTSREFLARGPSITRGPALCNVLQLIETLTPAKAATLSDQMLDHVTYNFNVGLKAHDLLESSQDQTLVRIARGDVQTAVNNLMDGGSRFGESKWASLQAAEKTLKGAIGLEGATFKFSHELSSFCEQLDDLGITFDWAPLIAKIQCNPGIRYGEVTCSREEAVEAHFNSLRLVGALADAGAKFKRKIGHSH